jgi:integrase
MDNLRTAFSEKYPKYANKIINSFEEANGCPCEWENLTKVRLARFVDFLSDELAPNSVKTYTAMMKSLLNLYSDEFRMPDDFAKVLSVKGCVSQNTYLNEDEIKKLIELRISDDDKATVRDQFVIGCLTGARHSDYVSFTADNITGDRLAYVSTKTHIKSEVPLSPYVRDILHRGFGKKNFSTSYFNDTLRLICRIAGITERVKLFRGGADVEGEKCNFVSSHTARRSYATNVYLECRDIFLVSRLLGHASVDMTVKYICTTDIPEELREYFSQFVSNS